MKQLETNRLILRKFKESDFAAVHSYASCPENIIFMVWGPNSEEETKSFIRTSIEKADETPCRNFQYAAISKDTGKLIGACDISISGDEGAVGWILHRDFWRRGYAAEMGAALLDFGFGGLGLRRIIATCDEENTASYKVMEKIGMRREGLFLDARPASKLSGKQYGDELSYAIVKDEWEARKENGYYNSLPCVFNGFIDMPLLQDGEIRLVCTAKNPEVSEKKWVPSYDFAICLGSEKIGSINLRIGYGGGFYGSQLYYGGHIGYNIDEKHRGNGYAGMACRALLPVAKAHGMEKLLITTRDTNRASQRVCEKLGMRLVRIARVPQWHDLYTEGGYRYVNIYEWSISYNPKCSSVTNPIITSLGRTR
jgi:RimJ/RimL family protein N-acetyltransferase